MTTVATRYLEARLAQLMLEARGPFWLGRRQVREARERVRKKRALRRIIAMRRAREVRS